MAVPISEAPTAEVHYARVDSPIGTLLVAVSAGALYEICFPDGPQARREPRPQWRHEPAAASEVARQLDEYFGGTRRRFELTLSPRGTPFQRCVWSALQAIPFGETRSYAEMARIIARPRAVRAVGAANGSNPFSIVVPCHRLLGSDGSLTGFGGGLAAKRYLLDLERARPVALNSLPR